MKTTLFSVFALAALMLSCEGNKNHDTDNDGNTTTTETTTTDANTGQQTAQDTAAAPGTIIGKIAKDKASSNCWYCGDYNMVTPPTNGGTPLPSPQRICGNNARWSGSCPSTTTLDDGSVWQLSGGCRCDG